MPDQHALRVAHDAVAARDVGEGAAVLERGRDRHGQPAAGLGVAEEHVGQGVAALLPGEPRLQDRRDGVGPAQVHRRAGGDDDDRARLRRGDPAHELVLLAGQREGLAVGALALPLLAGPDDDHGDVGRGRRRDGALEQVGRLRGQRTDAEAGQRAGRAPGAPRRATVTGTPARSATVPRASRLP